MKVKYIPLFALSLLFLCGCTKKMYLEKHTITPVPEIVTGVGYGPAAGGYTIEQVVKMGGYEFSTGKSSVEYSAEKAGDGLSWKVSVRGKAFGKKSEMDISLLTDTLGTIRGDLITATVNGTTKDVQRDAEDYGLVANIFNCTFLPLLSREMREGEVVSNQTALSTWKYAQKYNGKIDVTLNGEATYQGIPCYVFKFYYKSEPFRNKNREMIENIIEGFVMVDKKTMLIVRGQSINRDLREGKTRSDYEVINSIKATGI